NSVSKAIDLLSQTRLRFEDANASYPMAHFRPQCDSVLEFESFCQTIETANRTAEAARFAPSAFLLFRIALSWRPGVESALVSLAFSEEITCVGLSGDGRAGRLSRVLREVGRDAG